MDKYKKKECSDANNALEVQVSNVYSEYNTTGYVLLCNFHVQIAEELCGISTTETYDKADTFHPCYNVSVLPVL